MYSCEASNSALVSNQIPAFHYISSLVTSSILFFSLYSLLTRVRWEITSSTKFSAVGGKRIFKHLKYCHKAISFYVLRSPVQNKWIRYIVVPSQSLKLCPLCRLLLCHKGKPKGPLLDYLVLLNLGIYGIDCFENCCFCDNILHKCSVCCCY